MTRNSPTKPDVAGRPALAIENSIMNAANLGIVLATPPKSAMRCVCMRSYSTPTHRNIAAETKPCEIICARPPSMPCALNRKKPSVTMPMCEIDEYAISRFMSACTSATKPM